MKLEYCLHCCLLASHPSSEDTHVSFTGMQLAVLEARSKGWGRIGQAPKGRSQSAPRGVPRSRVAPAARPASITVCTALFLLTILLGYARCNIAGYLLSGSMVCSAIHAKMIDSRTISQQ